VAHSILSATLIFLQHVLLAAIDISLVQHLKLKISFYLVIHKAYTKYIGCNEMEWLIGWFWDIVKGMSAEQYKRFALCYWRFVSVTTLRTRLISKSEVMI